jgi:hypothetical protein
MVPDAIVQSSPLGQICPGDNLTLEAKPSGPSMGTYWDWYLRDGSVGLRYLGTGQRLDYALSNPSTFVLRSRTDQCVSSIERQLYVEPTRFIYTPSFSVINTNGKNSRYRSFQVSSPDMPGLRYKWYLNDQLLSAETERSTSKIRLQKGSNVVKLAVMNECNQVQYASSFVNMLRPSSFLFVALGASSNRIDLFPNLMATVGSRSMYLRAKFNPLSLTASKDQKSGFMGVPLEVNDKSQITNYPSSTGTYYEIGSGVSASHTGFTVGGMFTLIKSSDNYYKSLPVSLMLGAGYGIRDVFWSAQIRSYSNQSSYSCWVKNLDQSWRGLELEGGLFIPLSRKVFVMPGFSAIFDSNKKKPYSTISFAVGLAMKKKNQN